MGSGNRYMLHAWIHAAVSERRYMGERAPDWGEILCQHILVHLSRREFCFALSMSTPDAYLGTLHALKPCPAILFKKAHRIVESSSQEANGLLLVMFMAMLSGKPSEHAERAFQELNQHAINIRCRCPMA